MAGYVSHCTMPFRTPIDHETMVPDHFGIARAS